MLPAQLMVACWELSGRRGPSHLPKIQRVAVPENSGSCSMPKTDSGMDCEDRVLMRVGDREQRRLSRCGAARWSVAAARRMAVCS
jgi:hypothetical protein